MSRENDLQSLRDLEKDSLETLEKIQGADPEIMAIAKNRIIEGILWAQESIRDKQEKDMNVTLWEIWLRLGYALKEKMFLGSWIFI